MDPNQLLTVFTAAQVVLGAAVIYTVFTGRWELFAWIVIAGTLCTTLFGYWYVDARS